MSDMQTMTCEHTGRVRCSFPHLRVSVRAVRACVDGCRACVCVSVRRVAAASRSNRAVHARRCLHAHGSSHPASPLQLGRTDRRSTRRGRTGRQQQQQEQHVDTRATRCCHTDRTQTRRDATRAIQGRQDGRVDERIEADVSARGQQWRRRDCRARGQPLSDRPDCYRWRQQPAYLRLPRREHVFAFVSVSAVVVVVVAAVLCSHRAQSASSTTIRVIPHRPPPPPPPGFFLLFSKNKAVNLADTVGGTDLEKKVKAATSNENYPTPLSQLQEIANLTND